VACSVKHSFIDFGMSALGPHENGGIQAW